MDEAKLLEKLRLLDALYDGATTEGERAAAAAARRRILLRLEALESARPADDPLAAAQQWSRRVLYILRRRYGVDPARYGVQLRTTVVQVSRRVVEWTRRGGSTPSR